MLPPCAAFAQQAGDAGPTTSPSTPEGNYDPQQVLQDPNVTEPAAEIASIRLLAHHDDTTHAAVLSILKTGSTTAKIALARGLSSVPWPDEDFIEPLIALLRSRDPASAGAAAQALTQYRDNPQVLPELINQAKLDRPDIRPVIIPAVGAFAQKPAAETLVDLLDDPDTNIENAAINALIEMTGQTDFDHNADEWKQWYAKYQGFTDADFQAEIIRERGQAFEKELGDQRAFQKEADTFLTNDFWSAAPANRASILLAYLRSPAPEIRELGADLVFSSRSVIGAPEGTLLETRLLLSDPSAQVRAAAATALQGDTDSAPDLIAQLAVETDDNVRVKLITTLAPFDDPRAIEEMLKLVGQGSSTPVRIAAADGLSQGGDVINKVAALKASAIKTLEAALDGTELPGQQNLRRAIVGALAVIKDNSLSDVFTRLLAPAEDPGVRANALIGLGNMPDAAPFTHEIASHLQDTEPQMRLAAVKALHLPPNPSEYIDPLLKLMNDDPSDEVRRAAWQDLQSWAAAPDSDENTLVALADGLKGAPDKEIFVRKRICDRLKQDIQAAANDADRQSAEKELAVQQQVIGDLLSNPAINNPAEAATQYMAALNYWEANHAGPDVIRSLCKDIVDSLLAAKQWDQAANFAAGIIKQYGNDPATQTVATEFLATANTFDQSSDPDAYSDAMALMDAVQKMQPPLPSDYADQLENRRKAMQANHNAASRPQP